ncbi:MAG TPA: TetR/AcrR family transcriptional regulator [Candidatus Methylacidiphilales bacterium]|nr:TetR/AcrR family transcriptional regulator [Candidatus Methylacidiphilales bacterium]
MKQESESKRKLLEAAMEMIWESSYGSVSVDDICTKAGVNKGSFYYAFKSKSDLAVAAFERYWENKQPRMDTIFSPQASPLERLDNYCQLIIKDQKQKYQSFGKMLGCPFCSVGSELSTQDEKIRLKAEQMSRRVIKYHESLVRDLAAAGLIEVKDPAELARELYSYVTGVLMQAKIENNVKHVERLQHGVMRLLGIKEQLATAAP